MKDNTIEVFSTMDVPESERVALESEIATQFTRNGNTYHDKKTPDVVAFKDDGDKLSTVFRSIKVANAMTLLAASKGWQTYKTKGHKQFFTAVEKSTEQLTQRFETIDKGVVIPDDNQLGAEKVAELTDEQIAKNAAALKVVQEQYRVAGSKYYFKDQIGRTSTIAFKDQGEKLATSINTERVTKSMVELAVAKGWQTIKVSGHKDFKRQAWREAFERGLSVQGYTPTPQEQAELEARIPQNAITNAAVPEQGKGVAIDKDVQPEQRATATAASAKAKTRDHSGVLLAHGAANYKNEAEGTKSYFATVETSEGERTTWGVDLERAIDQAGAEVGNKVDLSYLGQRTVKVRQAVIDKDGKKAFETIEAQRNTWQVVTQERQNVIAAVGTAAVTRDIVNPEDRARVVAGIKQRVEQQKELPALSLYDSNAPLPAEQTRTQQPKQSQVLSR